MIKSNTFRHGPKTTKRIFWFMIAVGMILPWCVGIWVKLYLQAAGKPTVPWSYFLSPGSILLEIPLTIWFASPFIALAFLSRYVLSTPSFPYVLYWERLLMLVCGVIWGSVGMVKTFLEVFWEFDLLYFILVPLPAFYVDDILIGLFGGCAIAAISVLLRKGASRRQV
jgi:hypothetical protein